jgi:hypothetical protein
MSPDLLRSATELRFRTLRLLLTYLTFTLLFLMEVPRPLFAQEPFPGGSARHNTYHLKISATLSPATLGLAYSAVISVSGGTAPYTFQQQDLPLGLALNGETGGISGTPQAAGQFAFAVRVTDSTGNYGLGDFTLTVNNQVIGISITPASATVNSGANSQFQATVSNTSNTAVTWTASQGRVSASGLFTAPTVTKNTSVALTATSVANPRQSASANIAVVASVVSSNVSLEVLFPPTNPHSQEFQALQKYVLNNPIVSGGNLWVQWADVDKGPGANPQYDWTSTDSAIQPWAAAGKKVNLVIWAIGDSAVNTTTPQYVWTSLGPSNITTCKGEQIPNYFHAAFESPYQAFMAEVVRHYGSNPDVGYIRFGLGRGGEAYPCLGISSEPTCAKAFASWGFTWTSWTNYLASMLGYEATLKSPKQLMVGIVGGAAGSTRTVVADATAAAAVLGGIGFGSQGLQQADIANYPLCTSDWCNLFDRYTGSGPLELQTYLQSCPDNSCQTGSLVNLVPFAISHHATVLEIYYQDWLLAFDPTVPGYTPEYAQVLTQAAKTPIR